MALMAFLDSEVYTDKTCSKTCLKNYETFKKQCDDLIAKLNQTEFTVATYKRGLAIVKEQLITYRKNEVLFSEEVAVLKREVACKDYEINVLKSEFEKVKQEKEGIEFKIEKFDKASKYLDKLLESQITDKSKKGLGYSVVSPPYPLIYNRPKKLDLSYSGLDEFKGYGSQDSKKESNIVCDKKSDDSKENSDNSLVKEQVSKDTSSFIESSLNIDKETIFPVDKKVASVKPKNHEKPVKKSVRYAEMYRSQSPRGNQRNWNGQKSNQLGSDFVMYNKACFICGSFNHVQAQCKNHQRERMVYGSNYNRVNYNYTTKRTHPNAQRNMVPREVLMKTGLKTFNTARTVNTAHPKSIAQAVNTARPNTVKTARPNFAVVNAVRVNQANDEMLRPRDLGSNTPLGVPYTEEEILFLPRGMYIDAEIDEMLTSRDKMIDEAKEEAKRTRRELELLRGVVRFDDQMSQLLTQLGSHSEIGRGAGVGVVMFRFGRFFTGKLPGKNLENGRPLQVAVQQDFTRGRRHVIRESWLPVMLSWPRGPNLGCYKTISYVIVALCGMDDDYVSALDCLRDTIPSFDFSYFTNKDTASSKTQQTLASALFSEMVKDMEVHFDMTMRQKAVFECLRAPHAQDFLLVISIDGLGQHMSAVEYDIILKYHLLIPLFLVDKIYPVCCKAFWIPLGNMWFKYLELIEVTNQTVSVSQAENPHFPLELGY
ncbi:hypothetical protein Tco_1056136 [Tanacetum coccineum]|uniref:Uncharacterized protein n=1 Tax=Tanacetum coccineum TaxID=301880 RepID=A0ABQ5H2V7_9ASTR